MSEIENPPKNSIRPSRSEPPGVHRVMAAFMVDPWFFAFKLLSITVKAIATAVIEHREKKKAAREAKKGGK